MANHLYFNQFYANFYQAHKLFLGRRRRLPFKYNQKLRFHNHNKYLNQTSGPLPIIRLICRESKSSEILVWTLLSLLQCQDMCYHLYSSNLPPRPTCKMHSWELKVMRKYFLCYGREFCA